MQSAVSAREYDQTSTLYMNPKQLKTSPTFSFIKLLYVMGFAYAYIDSKWNTVL
jgi:hypothetical protein